MPLSDMRLSDALASIDKTLANVGASIKQQPNIPNLTADPKMADFNNLLAVLRTADVLASS